jgi:F-type H+-transporting ATPase subunit delta
MSSNALSSRYAKALMSTLTESGAVDQGLSALKGMAKVFLMADAARILKSPIMPREFKKDLLEYCLNKVEANKTVYNFVGVLLEAGRIELIPTIAEHFEALVLATKNEAHGEITSAHALNEQTLKEITAAAEKKLDLKLVLANVVDPSIFGGFKVRVGNKLLDMSIKTKLDQLTASAVQ